MTTLREALRLAISSIDPRETKAIELLEELAESALDIQSDLTGQTVIYLGDGDEDGAI